MTDRDKEGNTNKRGNRDGTAGFCAFLFPAKGCRRHLPCVPVFPAPAFISSCHPRPPRRCTCVPCVLFVRVALFVPPASRGPVRRQRAEGGAASRGGQGDNLRGRPPVAPGGVGLPGEGPGGGKKASGGGPKKERCR